MVYLNQFLLGMKCPQSGSVGGRDVDDQVVAIGGEVVDANLVVMHRFRRCLVLALNGVKTNIKNSAFLKSTTQIDAKRYSGRGIEG